MTARTRIIDHHEHHRQLQQPADQEASMTTDIARTDSDTETSGTPNDRAEWMKKRIERMRAENQAAAAWLESHGAEFYRRLDGIGPPKPAPDGGTVDVESLRRVERFYRVRHFYDAYRALDPVEPDRALTPIEPELLAKLIDWMVRIYLQIYPQHAPGIETYKAKVKLALAEYPPWAIARATHKAVRTRRLLPSTLALVRLVKLEIKPALLRRKK
jgi:hypothetical protein